MTSPRTLALLASLACTSLAARADSLPVIFVDTAQPQITFGSHTPESTSPASFASAADQSVQSRVPIGAAAWSLRPIDVASTVPQPAPVEFPPDAPGTVAPEPAGLLLLGTGALVTAFSIRRRLFAL